MNWFFNGSRYYEDLNIIEDMFIGIVFHVILVKSISEGALDAQAYAAAMFGNDFEKVLEEYSPHILINSKLSEDIREKQICGSLVFDFIENIKLPSLAAEVYNKYSYISDDKERNRLAFMDALEQWVQGYEGPLANYLLFNLNNINSN